MKKYLFALLLMLAGNVSLAQPTPLLPSTNLDQWWPFCSATDLLDRTMTGFDLLSSAVTGAPDRFGQPNKAYLFNGVNSELHYSTTLSMPIFGIADFSYSAHIFPTAVQHSIILYNGNPALDGLGIVMGDGAGGAGNRIGLLFGGLGEQFFAGAASTVTLSQWHHVLVRRNGNSYLLFVDGTLAGTYIPAGFPASGYNTPTTVFQVGLDFTNGVLAFDGRIDDIAAYSRQVSNAEVIALRDFNPNITINLGNDTALCPNQLTLGGMGAGDPRFDTTRFPNKQYYPSFGYKYTWSTGDTVRTRTTLTFPTTPTPPTVLTLNVTRMYSCPGFDAITVRHIIPVLNIGPDTSMCERDTILLNKWADTSGVIRFYWDDGSRWATRLAFENRDYWCRMDSLVPFVNPISGLNDTTHCVATDTAKVRITPEIFVMLGVDDTSCNGTAITLSSSYPYVSPTYLWQDGFTTTPTYSATTSGVYWLRVKDGACTRYDTINIVVANVSTSVLTNDTAICKGVSFVANATGAPGVLYQWTPTAGMAVSNIPTPTITPDTSSWYVVSATVIDPLSGALLNCKAQDSFFVDVQPVPIVKMGGNRVVCQYDSIRIVPTIIPNWYTNYIYDWTPGTYLDDSTAPNVVFTAGDTTKLILVVTTPAGCKSADSGIIFTFNGDFLSMSRDTSLCPGDSVVIMPVSTEPGVTTITWSPSTYVNYPIATTPVTIKPENNISYAVIGTSMYGCTDTLTYSIKVLPAAVINMVDSVTLFPGETSYEIEPLTNGTSYSWFPPVGLSDTAVSNPVATPYVNTKYILTSRTQDGCSTKDSIYINLSETSIINVPNAFVPGSNYNGSIKAIIKGTARLRYFRIFDRWGKLVFEGKDINIGWDGMVGGTPAPSGVYVYEAEAITERGRILHKQGNITLLK